MIEQALGGLRRRGYDVRAVAVDQALTPRPTNCRLTLCLGERVGDMKEGDAIAISSSLDIRGDIATGRLRRWVITRTFRAEGGCPFLDTMITLTLEGDISQRFLRNEGQAGRSMLATLLADLGRTFSQMGIDTMSAREPVAAIDVIVLGDLAFGRCGPLRDEDGVGSTTVEMRDAFIAICDRIGNDIVPGLAAACLSAISRSRPMRARSVAMLHDRADPEANTNAPRNHPFSGPIAGLSREATGSAPLHETGEPASHPFSPQNRGRYVH